ncbi:MAG TPA: FAD:protein FMN transferase [Phycisphaerales bacterium]|nr:FAD:protein FMN transferase [Phycisphaerales bacterium]
MTGPKPENPLINETAGATGGTHRFSHEAMDTVFEIVIVCDDGQYAAQASDAAFRELDILEAELSRFIENSDISRINGLDANEPLVIGIATFECLQIAAEMYDETNGVFDVSIGSGMDKMKLDEEMYSVVLLESGVRIDLGGIGKGFAVDKIAESLIEWKIDNFLIHGGASSILAKGTHKGGAGWPLTLSNPENYDQIIAHLSLTGRAVSGSGIQQQAAHIIDPRTGKPVTGRLAAWSCGPDATAADALSTAFMVMSAEEIETFCKGHCDVQAIIVEKDSNSKTGIAITTFGDWRSGASLKR